MPRTAVQRLLSRRDIPLREKTLRRMLYETAARPAKVLETDVRDPEHIADAYAGVVYQQVDLIRDTSPELMRSMLDDVLGLLRAGTLTPLPTQRTALS